MKPIYTLTNLSEEERAIYDELKREQLNYLQFVKDHYFERDKKISLNDLIEYNFEIVKKTNQAVGLSEIGIEPPFIKPDKWEYVVAVEMIPVYEAELKQLEKQEPPTTQKLKSERSNNFSDCICDRSKTEVIMKVLHEKLDGSKSGKDTAITLFAAASAGLIRKPTFTQSKNEFNLRMSRQNFNQEYKKCEDKARTITEIDPLKSFFLTI